MMKTHRHVLMLLSYCCWLHCAATRGAHHFNGLSLNGAADATGVASSGVATTRGVSLPSAAAAATASLSDQHDWQPMSAHSNWIFVQSSPARVAGQPKTPRSAANRFIQAYTTGQRDAAPRTTPYNGGYVAAERPQSQWTYNTLSRRHGSSANHTFASSSLNAANALRRHSLDRADVTPSSSSQQPYATVVLPQPSLPTAEVLRLTPHHFRQRASPAGGVPSERGATTPPDAKLPVLDGGSDKTAGNAIENDVGENVDAYGVGADVDDIDDERLDELLLPLQGAVERVRDFCDIVQGIISQATGAPEDDEDSKGVEEKSDGEWQQESSRWADATTNDAQGRSGGMTHSFAANSASTAHLTSSFAGSGRKSKKIKKKLKKLLLPLLIAYKLKFMALIPVLIGGLTLLVGTTGMAGFFFALFTAVMSLKGSGSKSIVLKKI